MFSEWSLAVGNIVTRTEYALNNLLESKSISALPLFSDLGEEQFLPEPLRKYPAVNYMYLSNELI